MSIVLDIHFQSVEFILCVCIVEMLRQLLLRDLEEDSWSHDSDDTATNETAGERSPLDGDQQRPESLETVLKFSTEEWDTEPEDGQTADGEQPPLQVIRKGNDLPF